VTLARSTNIGLTTTGNEKGSNAVSVTHP